MLRKVVFALRDGTGNRLQLSLRSLIQELKQHGIEVAYAICLEDGGCGEQSAAAVCGEECLLKKHGSICAADQAEPDTLYITDSSVQYCIWQQRGKYVLPYRHQWNQEDVFEGAEYMIERLEEVDYEVVDMAYRRLAGVPWEIFRTERCIVRETIVEDVDSLYGIYAEPAITEYMEDLYQDRDEEIAYIKDYRRRMYGFYGYGIWSVLSRRDGQVIGRAGISWREEFDVPELGFVIGVPWQRQGYAYEVCSAILRYAWKDIGFKQIQALVMEHNEKSSALCRKLGFEDNGITVLENVRYILYKMQLNRGCGREKDYVRQ